MFYGVFALTALNPACYLLAHTHKLTEVLSALQIMPTNQYKPERDNAVKLARAILNRVANAPKQPMIK